MKEIQRRQVFVLVYLFLILCIGNVRGANEMCRADKILTGKDDEVDWWFITKVKGFGDVYLYVDSTMDNTATFKTGYYLRSVHSALGSTVSPFTGGSPDDKKNFISFCDYAASSNQATESFSKFYEAGAHQKGMIGWTETSNNEWKGFYIDHSMPYFPQIHSKTFMNGPINFDPEKITATLTQEQLSLTRMYFSYYGWRKPFFGRNLMPIDSGGCVKDYLLKHDQDRSDPIYRFKEKFIKPDQKESAEKEKIAQNERNLKGAVIKMDDIFPFAIVHTHKLKPSQHIFCISIDTKDKFLDFFKHYQYISNEGIVSNIHKVSDSSLSDIKPYISLYDENDNGKPTEIDRKNLKEFNNQKLSFANGITAESTINVNLGTTIGNDVWKGLIANQASKTEPYLDNGATIFISTWSDADSTAWWRTNNQIKEPVFIADVHNSKIKWKSNSHGEHSKIAFTESQTHKIWNVCIGGGNLYTSSKSDPIKSSIILCLKLDALHSALTKLKDSTWDGNPTQADKDEFDAYNSAYGKAKKNLLKLNEGDYLVDFIESNWQEIDLVSLLPGYTNPLASEFSKSKLKAKRLCQKLQEQSRTTPTFTYSELNDQGLINMAATANLQTVKFENSFTVKKPRYAGRNQDPDSDRLVQLGGIEETFMSLFKTLIPFHASTEYQSQLYKS